MALFSSARPQQSSHLVEFRAGKMFTRGGGETGAPITVHPDKRKGMVYISQSDDALMHFCWKDRTTGVVEDDLIVFPDDVEFIRVDQCTTGRVFLLKFKNSTRKLFFWMQEPKDDKDEEYRRKVNELLNHPPAPGSGRSGRGGAGQDVDQFSMMNQLLGLGGSGGGASEERMDLQNALAGMDQQQLMQLLNLMGSGGGGGPSFGSFMESTPPTASAPRRAATAAAVPATTTTQPATAAAPSASGGQPGPGATAVATEVHEAGSSAPGAPRAPTDSHQTIQVTDLRNILANLGGTQPTQPTGEAAVDLEAVLAAGNIEQSVRKPENEARLLPHLPDEEPIEKTREELLLTIRSPQFRQAVDMFGTALQTGQLAPLMSQFGLPPGAIEACARGDVQSVAEILERESGGASASGGASGGEKDKKKKGDEAKGSEPPNKKDKQDDENMELD